jgi:hypothetical protein
MNCRAAGRAVCVLLTLVLVMGVGAPLGASGSSDLAFSTFLGGSGYDGARYVAVAGDGTVVVAGHVHSGNLATPGAFDTTYAGSGDIFVAKFNPEGTGLVYFTYLGGDQFEAMGELIVDAGGAAYVAGYTQSQNFSTTVGAYQEQFGGGEFDAFLAKLSPGGDQLEYSTFVGGGNRDTIQGLAIDGQGRLCIAGHTRSGAFLANAAIHGPTPSPGVNHPFVAVFNPELTGFVSSREWVGC